MIWIYSSSEGTAQVREEGKEGGQQEFTPVSSTWSIR